MRRTFIASWLAVVLLGGVAAADDQPQTLKADDHCFTDLSTRAGDGSLDLGKRTSAGSPDYTETEEIAPQRLPASVVQAVVADKMGEVEYCWEKATAHVKAPAGEVSVSFVILPRGNVGSVHVAIVGPRSKALEKCVAQRVARWHFPSNDVNTEVSIPFAFGTAGNAL